MKNINYINDLDKQNLHNMADICDDFLFCIANSSNIRLSQSPIDINSMSRMRPHELLNVSQNSSEDQIKKAWRLFVKQYHPDINRDPNASEAFKLGDRAYKTLINNTSSNITTDQFDDWIHGINKNRKTKVHHIPDTLLVRMFTEPSFFNQKDYALFREHLLSCQECIKKAKIILDLIKKREAENNKPFNKFKKFIKDLF